MKVSKRRLRRIIRENCGMSPMPVMDGPVANVAEPVDLEPSVVSEGVPPEHALVLEMEVASRALEQVVESVQNAAQLCANCAPAVAVQVPLVEAMVAQAEALQENLVAQAEVILENSDAVADFSFTGDVAELSGDEAFGIGYEAGTRGLG